MPLFDDIHKPDDADKQAQYPIPLEALRMGFASQEAYTEKNMQESKDAASNFFNLPSYGPDVAVMQQAKQAFQNATKGISTANFSDPQTSSKINSIISQITQNPEVQAAVSRGTTYQRMVKEKERAEAAGKEYINPGWDDAQKYYSGNNFIKNKQFSSDGWIAPDIAKGMNEALKDAIDTKRVYDPTTGEYVLTDVINKDKANLVVKNYLATTPNAMKTYNYNLENQLQGTDWDHAAKDRIVDDYHKNEELLANTAARYKASTDVTERQVLNDEYNKHLEFRNKLKKINDMQGTGQMVKDQYKSYLQDKQLNDYVEAYTHFKEGKGELDKKTELAIQHSNKLGEEGYMSQLRIKEDQQKELFKAASKIDQIKNSEVKDFYKRYYSVTGQIPVDGEGKMIPIQDLPDVPSLRDLKNSAGKAQVKDHGEKTIGNTLSNLASGVETTTDKDILISAIKNKGQDLGFPEGTTFENIKFEDGKVKFDAKKPNEYYNRPYTKTVDELKDKWGVSTGTATSTTTTPTPKTKIKYEDFEPTERTAIDKFMQDNPKVTSKSDAIKILRDNKKLK